MTVGTGYRVEQIGTGAIGITYLICTRIPAAVAVVDKVGSCSAAGNTIGHVVDRVGDAA